MRLVHKQTVEFDGPNLEILSELEDLVRSLYNSGVIFADRMKRETGKFPLRKDFYQYLRNHPSYIQLNSNVAYSVVKLLDYQYRQVISCFKRRNTVRAFKILPIPLPKDKPPIISFTGTAFRFKDEQLFLSLGSYLSNKYNQRFFVITVDSDFDCSQVQVVQLTPANNHANFRVINFLEM